jgi:hypothetical protein
VVYPAVIKSVGEAPKQFGNVINAPVLPAEGDDFDFLNEMGISEEDTEDFSEVTDTGEEGEEEIQKADDEEDDEFSTDFPDDEGFEDEPKLPHGDDY